MKKPAPPEGGIQVLHRMDRLLEELARREEPGGLAEIAAAAGLHVSTVHRILSDLVSLGYVDRPGAGKYCLGDRVLELAARVEPRRDLRREARGTMEALRDEIGESVFLAVREGDEIVYLDRVPGVSSVRVEYAPGTRSTLHLDALGKLYLADAGFEACAAYARRTRLSGATPHSIRDLPRLYRELERIQRTGYSLENEEREAGVTSIGVPVRDASGRLCAGLALAAPTMRYRDTWIPRVQKAGNSLSGRLGWQRRRGSG